MDYLEEVTPFFSNLLDGANKSFFPENNKKVQPKKLLTLINILFKLTVIHRSTEKKKTCFSFSNFGVMLSYIIYLQNWLSSSYTSQITLNFLYQVTTKVAWIDNIKFNKCVWCINSTSWHDSIPCWNSVPSVCVFLDGRK